MINIDDTKPVDKMVNEFFTAIMKIADEKHEDEWPAFMSGIVLGLSKGLGKLLPFLASGNIKSLNELQIFVSKEMSQASLIGMVVMHEINSKADNQGGEDAEKSN